MTLSRSSFASTPGELQVICFPCAQVEVFRWGVRAQVGFSETQMEYRRPLPEKSEANSRPGCRFSSKICLTRDVKEAKGTEPKEEAKETEAKEEKGEEDVKDAKDEKNENEEKDEHEEKEKEVKAADDRCGQRLWFV